MLHNALLGINQITDLQKSLYLGKKHGFSTKENISDLIDSTIIQAMAFSREGTIDTTEFYDSYIFSPNRMHPWIMDRIYNMAVGFTKRTKGSPRRREALECVQKWLGHLKIGQLKLCDIHTEPERWVAVGYTKEDDFLPNWFKDALLDIG